MTISKAEYFVLTGFVWFSLQIGIIYLNRINQFVFVMVKCGVFCEVRAKFLSIIQNSFDFKVISMLLPNESFDFM